MTNRERIIKTLLCEKTDRAPFPMWLGFQPWGETHSRWKQESGISDLDTWRYFGFEPFFQGVPAHMGPEYDRMAAFDKRHNIPILSVDTDGLVNQLVPAFI